MIVVAPPGDDDAEEDDDDVRSRMTRAETETRDLAEEASDEEDGMFVQMNFSALKMFVDRQSI